MVTTAERIRDFVKGESQGLGMSYDVCDDATRSSKTVLPVHVGIPYGVSSPCDDADDEPLCRRQRRKCRAKACLIALSTEPGCGRRVRWISFPRKPLNMTPVPSLLLSPRVRELEPIICRPRLLHTLRTLLYLLSPPLTTHWSSISTSSESPRDAIDDSQCLAQPPDRTPDSLRQA